MTSKLTLTAPAVALVLATTGIHAAGFNGTNWLDQTISPVSNPIYFEDAKINSEVHPVYMYHILPSTFRFEGGAAPLGGNVQVMAVQLRYAINDRLAIIATKDGYIQFLPDHTLAHKYGWADLAAGVKYAVVDDPDSQFLVTPGLTVTVPTGSSGVYQERGSGQENVFVSSEKGFDKFHALGNVGFIIPNQFAQGTAQLHYSLQLDYYLHQYLIPFAVVNGYTILTDGNDKLAGAVPLNTEGYDLINFGSTDAAGTTQFTVGGGIRSRIFDNLDVGIAYEAGVIHPVGIFEGRITADLVWRF